MSLEKAVEAIIQEAMQRGDFDNLRGQGQPLDLSAYFDTPEDLRLAYSVLKNAGVLPAEIDLLQEIAALKERLQNTCDEPQRHKLRRLINDKQTQFDLWMEHQKRQRRNG